MQRQASLYKCERCGIQLDRSSVLGQRNTQVEATENMVQEGHQAIADAGTERRTKARVPGCPHGSGRAIQPLVGACNVDDWMEGLDEGASNWGCEKD